MLYIAYGSNIGSYEMRVRCPDAKFVDIGMLNDYKLVMRRYLDVDYAPDEIIGNMPMATPIVAWELSENDWKNLDRYEGYPDLYEKKTVKVNLKDDKKGTTRDGIIYIMTDYYKNEYPYKICDDIYYNRVMEAYKERHFNERFLTDALDNYINYDNN